MAMNRADRDMLKGCTGLLLGAFVALSGVVLYEVVVRAMTEGKL